MSGLYTAATSPTAPDATSGYRVLSRARYGFGPYTLRALGERDMEPIRRWRNDQLHVLRQAAPLSREDQQRYWREQVVPDFRRRQPRQILLAFLENGELAGYTGLTNLCWRARRAELSFLLAPARAAHPKLYARGMRACLSMLIAVAFGELGLNRIFAETYDVRPRHVALLERQGFRAEGRLRQHVRLGDQLVDSLVHGLIREDWRGGA